MSNLDDDVAEILITEEQIKARTRELGRQISESKGSGYKH